MILVVSISPLLYAETELKDEEMAFENSDTSEQVNLIEAEEVEDDKASSNSIIVQTSNIEELQKDDAIEEITEVAEGIYIIDYSDEEIAKEKAEDLSNSNYVDKVVEDSKMRALDISDGIDYAENVNSSRIAWGVTATGIDHYVDYLDLGIKDKRTIRVAVLDTGINAYHEAFAYYYTADRIDTTYSYNYVSNNTNITDDEGHGTGVASIIAQSTPFNVKIVPIKVLDSDGSGYTTDILKAVKDVKNHVDIINLSLGHDASKDSAEEKALYESILSSVYNNGKGPIIVCAAGNESSEVNYPACSSYTLAITSLKQDSGSFTFSSSFSNFGSAVDFSAPGENLVVADYQNTDSYKISSGTSLSTPFVCSAIALLKTEYTLNTFSEVKNKLIQYSDDLGATGKDNFYGNGSINFITNRFERPVIARVESPSLTWEEYNLEIDAVCDDSIVKIAYAKSGETLTWYSITNPSTRERITLNVPENGTYTISLMDSEGETVSQTVKVVPRAIYKSHVQGIGWQDYVTDGVMSGTTGRALRIEAIRIKLGNVESGGLTYRSYIQGTGWQSYVSTDGISGTSGKGLRIEAIQIELTGQIANEYDIYYCVHAQGYGWLGWAKNGQTAGTTGYGKRIEGIKIIMIAKNGTAPTKLGTYTTPSLIYVPPKKISYSTHVQGIGWQNYVSNGESAGTTGQSRRLEAIKIKLENINGGVQYKSHIQGIGWESSWKSNNQLSGTSGKGLRLEAIKINLTGEAALQYDVYYRVHAQGFGWLGWAKNGESAGTAGYGKRLEAIQIKLVTKGGAAPGSTAGAFKQK